MKINLCLSIASALLVLSSCGSNKRLPKRKDGDTCKITFASNVDGLTCDNSETVPIHNNGEDLELHLKIPYFHVTTATWSKEPTMDADGELSTPNHGYNVNNGDITVTIGGEEFNESFTYFGETNNKNVLTIAKEYIVNDIEIKVNARDKGRLFLFGFKINGKSLQRDDIKFKFQSNYQDEQKDIHTLGEKAYPVFEDDEIHLTITGDEALPDNIWFRCTARYTEKDLEFFRKYENPIIVNGKTEGYKTCKIDVPHYVVRDHGSFVQFGEV